jgi:hypothetical protein
MMKFLGGIALIAFMFLVPRLREDSGNATLLVMALDLFLLTGFTYGWFK